MGNIDTWEAFIRKKYGHQHVKDHQHKCLLLGDFFQYTFNFETIYPLAIDIMCQGKIMQRCVCDKK